MRSIIRSIGERKLPTWEAFFLHFCTKTITINDGDDEYEDTIYFELYEFGNVDPEFVDFMKNVRIN